MQQHTDVAFKGSKPNCPPHYQQKYVHKIFFTGLKEATQFSYNFWLRAFNLLQSEKERNLWAPFHLLHQAQEISVMISWWKKYAFWTSPFSGLPFGIDKLKTCNSPLISAIPHAFQDSKLGNGALLTE